MTTFPGAAAQLGEIVDRLLGTRFSSEGLKKKQLQLGIIIYQLLLIIRVACAQKLVPKISPNCTAGPVKRMLPKKSLLFSYFLDHPQLQDHCNTTNRTVTLKKLVRLATYTKQRQAKPNKRAMLATQEIQAPWGQEDTDFFMQTGEKTAYLPQTIILISLSEPYQKILVRQKAG